MEILRSSSIFIILLVFVPALIQTKADSVYCSNPRSRCYGKYIECPYECPSTSYGNYKAKVCHVNCDSPVCKSYCKHRKPDCNGPGSACYDPRFIGGDGIVFYFHGKSVEAVACIATKNQQQQIGQKTNSSKLYNLSCYTVL